MRVGERRKLAYAGCAIIALAVTERGELADDPQVELIGIPEKDAKGAAISEAVYDVVVETFEQLPRARRRDGDAIAESIRRAARGSIAQVWGKKTLCLVQVLMV